MAGLDSRQPMPCAPAPAPEVFVLPLRPPYLTLGNTERLCPIHPGPPLAGCQRDRARQWRPFGPVSLQDLHPYYEHTNTSAPVPRIGTLTLTESIRLDFSLRIGTTGSQVPYRSLSQSHAAFVPDAGGAVSRSRPTLIPEQASPPVLTSLNRISTRHQRFTCVRLFDPHLTESRSAFSSTLTTRTLNPRSLRWFGACSCKPTPRDLPSSSVKHR